MPRSRLAALAAALVAALLAGAAVAERQPAAGRYVGVVGGSTFTLDLAQSPNGRYAGTFASPAFAAAVPVEATVSASGLLTAEGGGLVVHGDVGVRFATADVRMGGTSEDAFLVAAFPATDATLPTRLVDADAGIAVDLAQDGSTFQGTLTLDGASMPLAGTVGSRAGGAAPVLAAAEDDAPIHTRPGNHKPGKMTVALDGSLEDGAVTGGLTVTYPDGTLQTASFTLRSAFRPE